MIFCCTHHTLYLRYRSTIGPWRVGVPLAHFVVYATLHIYMLCGYVGHTVQALAPRLRKHMTDAAAMTDESRFQSMLWATRCCDWFIIPLQLCSTEFEACVCLNARAGSSYANLVSMTYPPLSHLLPLRLHSS